MAKTAAAKKRTEETHVMDEYDLQPGELTKSMTADKLSCSIRKVEMLKADGKLAAEKKTRRIDGVVKPNQLIFMESDVDEYKAKEAEGVKVPTHERSLPAVVERTVDNQNQGLAMLAHAMGLGPKKDPFLEIDAAAVEYNLSVAGLKQLVKDEVLTRYSGKNGKTMLSRRQIENL